MGHVKITGVEITELECECGLIFINIEGYRQHLVNGTHNKMMKRKVKD